MNLLPTPKDRQLARLAALRPLRVAPPAVHGAATTRRPTKLHPLTITMRETKIHG